MYRNGERGSGMKYIEIYKCRERQWQGKTIQILEYQTDMRTCRFDKPSSLLRSYIADTSALPMLELGHHIGSGRSPVPASFEFGAKKLLTETNKRWRH